MQLKKISRSVKTSTHWNHEFNDSLRVIFNLTKSCFVACINQPAGIDDRGRKSTILIASIHTWCDQATQLIVLGGITNSKKTVDLQDYIYSAIIPF